jgi:hypothetical protein
LFDRERSRGPSIRAVASCVGGPKVRLGTEIVVADVGALGTIVSIAENTEINERLTPDRLS